MTHAFLRVMGVRALSSSTSCCSCCEVHHVVAQHLSHLLQLLLTDSRLKPSRLPYSTYSPGRVHEEECPEVVQLPAVASTLVIRWIRTCTMQPFFDLVAQRLGVRLACTYDSSGSGTPLRGTLCIVVVGAVVFPTSLVQRRC